jgi:hypothetical protein
VEGFECHVKKDAFQSAKNEELPVPRAQHNKHSFNEKVVNIIGSAPNG